MVSLRSDGLRKCAARIVAGAESIDDVLEIVLRPPTQLATRAFVDVDAIDARQHAPAALGVLGFELRNVSSHDARCVRAQLCQIVARERCRRADDVLTETGRRRAL